MNLLSIAKKVGSSIIKNVIPGAGIILDAVNEFLPDNKKLPSDTTGEQLLSAVDSLPPEQRASLLEKEFDVDLTQIKESNSTLRTMLEYDSKNPHSTRPYIAKGAFHVVAFVIITVITVWACGVLRNNGGIVGTVMDGWQFILAVIGPLITLLWAYFGILKQEHKNKLSAVTGTPIGKVASLIKSFTKR